MINKSWQIKKQQARLRRMGWVLIGGCLFFLGNGSAVQARVDAPLFSQRPFLENPDGHFLKQQDATGSSDNGMMPEENSLDESLCQPPVLSRLRRHQVQPGETLDMIAARYGLIPATLLSFNSTLENGSLTPGQTLIVPPYNGVRVQVSPGKTWQSLADQFNVRADVLFELNGCGSVPQAVFVPGASGLTNPAEQLLQQTATALNGFPLPAIAPVMRDYGWQALPQSVEVEFHGGVDLSAEVGTPVLSVGDGVVAFADEQGDYGKLVVINHSQGLQTRYAQLSEISVQPGQRVNAGQSLGQSGETGLALAPHLHFEVRANSAMGWVAQDPSNYLDNMRMFER